MLSRLLTLAVLLLLLVPATPQAQDAAISETDRAAIQAVIQSQLSAFQRDDWPAAFAHASPAIQRKFGDAESFMAMVRSGYSAVYRPSETEMRALRRLDGSLVQEVLFVGPDGQAVTALYRMEQQPDGSWRIAGVLLLAAPDTTA